ncbi:putative cinnamoyl-CoA reductase [Lentithecium fluviatile CBS 122367]|uniref:Putative cinnamoyl-CoA reductase n=1 Tax=Lentithecium fluviatile CBS 122367 TaxID=1168545 RepID=A0A6G1IE29_9PLEO|nr:putative cinnamoyl-CoA reductase [Lentithecium fluviatile CBS 122367]
MASPNLLITGVTGFIGFRVLLDALAQGYVVRAAVRSSSQMEALRSHPKIEALAPGDKLSFVEVLDFTREDAYLEAVQGVKYIIHLASPLPSPALDPQTGIYEPTVKSLASMLRAASTTPSLKKLVITASVFANMAFPPDVTAETTADSRVADRQGPFSNIVAAYSSGKVAALNATDAFIKEKKPSFAVVNIFPGFVFGTDDKALSVKNLMSGTNRILLSIIRGVPAPSPMPAGVAHVYDVAKLHLLVLQEGVVGNYGVTKAHVFDDAWEIVKKHFPKAVDEGIFSQGRQQTVPVKWDAHKTETEFGFNFRTYEDIVVDVAGQFLELSGEEKA